MHLVRVTPGFMNSTYLKFAEDSRFQFARSSREDERGASWFRPGGLDAEKSLLSHASGIQVLGP